MDGILLLNKPIGVTSRKVSNMISKTFNEKKVGHVGTLDPFASGLLIVAMGKSTKAVTFFDESIKEYEATIKLGVETDTLDNTGKVIKEEKVKSYSIDEIEDALHSFLGDSKQIPPMTSAIHVNGKRLYELAHQGIEVDRPIRDIHIFDIKLLSYENDEVRFYAKVSKGTYIRTLGSDIAKKLGTIGYLTNLIRVGVGPFKLEETSDTKVYSTSEILSRFIKTITISDKAKINDIKNGKVRFLEIDIKENRILIVDSSFNAVAIYSRNSDNKLEFTRGLF